MFLFYLAHLLLRLDKEAKPAVKTWRRIEVSTAVSMKISVLRVVELCSLVDVNQRFRGHTASVTRAMNPYYTAQQPRRQKSSTSSLPGIRTTATALSERSLVSEFLLHLQLPRSEPHDIMACGLYSVLRNKGNQFKHKTVHFDVCR
jgi:hypothetical protein